MIKLICYILFVYTTSCIHCALRHIRKCILKLNLFCDKDYTMPFSLSRYSTKYLVSFVVIQTKPSENYDLLRSYRYAALRRVDWVHIQYTHLHITSKNYKPNTVWYVQKIVVHECQCNNICQILIAWKLLSNYNEVFLSSNFNWE